MKEKNKKLQKLFFEQFRESKFSKLLWINQTGLFEWGSTLTLRKLSLIYTREWDCLADGGWQRKKKQLARLTSTTLNILKIWLPDKKTTFFSFCVEGDQGKIFNERTLNPFVSLENNFFAFMINHRYAWRV